ncbi:MAG: Phosphoribosylanthranilate isomerase [Thermodesulfobacterium sp.]|uniref:N-(5'-phosphoribosyl)anthranilate isomerase n=1 Tax=Candidatus Thermodesulfobacterium syntrophicum TaxID=3060442 RepID=A0AAE3P506_9BACT|nr:Phosphoribosylanthranilate isomerase [Candidatus Thermodesulfobacterium syntrophicum]
MVKVKICGVKFIEDVEFLNAQPLDYIGFIMYPKSPRFVGSKLKELLFSVKKAKKVVVFVNPGYEDLKQALDFGADFIQLHGNESPEVAKKIGFERVIKAFRVGDSLDFKIFEPWRKCYAILLDTYVEGIPGGTGETFNWDIAKNAVNLGYRIFLAGGLKPENVLEAVKTVNPFAIDIAGGVEAFPGKKDFRKIRALFEVLKV